MRPSEAQILFVVISLIAFALDFGNAALFNVMNYGAVGDGKHDDAKAFVEAWKAVCEFGGVMYVPEGRNFLLSPVNFQGPCNSTFIHIMVSAPSSLLSRWMRIFFLKLNSWVQISGNVMAPNDKGAWKGCTEDTWLYFSNIKGLMVYGSGKINANGELWWENNALQFVRCDGLNLNGLTHLNSPRNHIGIHRSNNVNISQLRIIAPKDSPNTDGIDVSCSTNVTISRSIIQTGDDCIAINNGSSDIRIMGISCGPGHGISVGSLGRDGSYAAVERIFVTNCNFFGSQNGVRIKTWQGGSGYARDIHFKNITLKDVKNPIIIDQFYCIDQNHCEDQPSAVEVSHVSYEAVYGSSANEKAIQLSCSKSKPCTNIQMFKINIISAIHGEKAYATCNNAKGIESLIVPRVPCLS
ncbi:hypothetical protein M9H77_25252 [Catharanthus roseus]|uniref:Uncharacterized protein n=1 Tax=Catharanthus roseus TaxID=4058 RepID=A0ACC0A8E4_CATRO|nr:hypothetical protein M9H77_25252 [Catharanthus roseus]